MRIGYFDCFCGAAGDMILGALIDAGAPLGVIQETVARLGLRGVSLTAERVQRRGLAATLAHVHVAPGSQTTHRYLPQILQIIKDAGLEASVAQHARSVFRRLAEAEARAHGIPVDQVHFHEVGAADAIIDVIGCCAGLAALGIDRVACSPIPAGSGTVRCEHGLLPLPAPATGYLLQGVPIASCEEPGELTTPTGAALLTTLATEFGPLPEMTITAVGSGAGSREGQTRANLLRLFVGESAEPADAEHDTVIVLETQLDDATGQVLGYASERLLQAGALDAYIVPIIMKKGRPGQLLTVLCRPRDEQAFLALLFAETNTLGVRRSQTRRVKLSRRHVTVRTRFGEIRVKVAGRGAKIERACPEYEDCAKAARAADVPLRQVQAEALRVWAQEHDDREHD